MLQFGQKANEAQLGDVLVNIATLALDPVVEYTIPVYKRIVLLNLTHTEGYAFKVNLPSPGLCPNAVITLNIAIPARATNAHVLTLNVGASTDVTLTGSTTEARATKHVWYSDGLYWHLLAGSTGTLS